jgi:hypothetical protein
VARLAPELADALRAIAEADGGRHVRFTPFFVAQVQGPIRVDPHFPNPQLLQRGVMFALEELGFVQIAAPTSPNNEYGPVQITAAGRDAAARHFAGAPGASTAPVDLSWDRLRSVLVATVELWERGGAREPVSADAVIEAVADDFEPSFIRVALDLLADDEWLDGAREMGTEGPIDVTPRHKALQEVRGWPAQATDAAVVAALLAALDIAIARTNDPEEKTRLQRLRDAAGDVGKSVLASAIVAAGKAAAGG